MKEMRKYIRILKELFGSERYLSSNHSPVSVRNSTKEGRNHRNLFERVFLFSGFAENANNRSSFPFGIC